jgi:hypothetical protein
MSVRIVVLALFALAVTGVSPAPAAAPATISCGVPDARPAWIDYADSSVTFWRDRFARPGIVAATSTVAQAGELRASGAATVFWDMNLVRRVGSPTAPLSPSAVDAAADKILATAIQTTSCSRPLIVLNELWGASDPTPWTDVTQRYRANVLRYVQRLAARGARPALLVAASPYVGGDAAAWWRSVGAVSDVVLERYTNGKLIAKQGPVAGSRRLRLFFRGAASQMIATGVKPERVGIMLGFQTRIGYGGREGLQPAEKWFEVVKLQSLAARQVAGELRLGHVWSWGWGTFNEEGRDPDKQFAACAWLWARDARLCDAPVLLGSGFDLDREIGQLRFPAGVRCLLGRRPIANASISAVAKVTGDRDAALTGLYARLLETEKVGADPAVVTRTENAIVASRFDGSRAAYLASLAKASVSLITARAVIADELRREALEARFNTPSVPAADVAEAVETYASMRARDVVVTPSPAWLPAGRGLALEASAPAGVLSAPPGRSTVKTAGGTFTLRALGPALPLGTFPAARVVEAVRQELGHAGVVQAYEDWNLTRQRSARTRTVCQRDELPEPGNVRLADFIPFLSLREGAAPVAALAR